MGLTLRCDHCGSHAEELGQGFRPRCPNGCEEAWSLPYNPTTTGKPSDYLDAMVGEVHDPLPAGYGMGC